MVPRGWLPSACGIPVKRVPMPYMGPAIPSTVPAMGVLHTIEGSLPSGDSVFRQHYRPVFGVGPGVIEQYGPLGFGAAALEHPFGVETNNWARAQIELAGFSKTSPWYPDAKTAETLAHLFAALSFPNVAGIPLTRPFPDTMPPGPWATTSFVRRSAGKWGKVAGWYGHVEIPNNSHWDPGAFEWSKLLTRARQIAIATGAHQPAPKS